jgi:hypothetical protein
MLAILLKTWKRLPTKMFSSDKNIETISQLIEMVKHNIELRKEYARLDIVEKIVCLLSATAIAMLVGTLLTAVLLFASIAIAVWLSQFIGMAQSFLAVSAGYALLLLLVYVSRKSWIERPLVKYLSRLLLN